MNGAGTGDSGLGTGEAAPESRLGARMEQLRASGRKALIPYITAGDPHPDKTVAMMHALVLAGADVIELGVPFSDPMADGPVIQLACERALAAGTTLSRVLAIVRAFRERDAATPVVLMGYLNPIEARGVARFAQEARAAGVDGVLVVDLAPEEAPEFTPALQAAGLDSIFLIAPTSSEARVRAAAEYASGYLYYVSLKGVTGSRAIDTAGLGERIGMIRAASGLPVAVGFGIRDAETAAAVGRVADGVIVGTMLVAEIAAHAQDPQSLPQRLADKLKPLRAALDGVVA